jgi:protein TonB
MKIKKNPKSNLETKSGMFVQIGLIIAMTIALIAFEWKSYEDSASDLGTMELALEDEEMIPITQREIKPPPPPPPPPEVIQIVEDDVEI